MFSRHAVRRIVRPEWLLLAATSLALCAVPVRAQDIIVSNLVSPLDGVRDLNGQGDRVAVAFRTDVFTRQLTDITIPLGLNANGLWEVTVDFTDDNSGQPGSLLSGSNTVALNNDAIINRTFTPTSGVVLAPNTIYWAVLRGQRFGQTANVWWRTTSSAVFEGVGSVPAATATATSTDAGANWSVFATSADVQRFRVRGINIEQGGAAAPEPTSLALLGFAVLTGGVALRRRSG
jgi:hypothetical protein